MGAALFKNALRDIGSGSEKTPEATHVVLALGEKMDCLETTSMAKICT